MSDQNKIVHDDKLVKDVQYEDIHLDNDESYRSFDGFDDAIEMDVEQYQLASSMSRLGWIGFLSILTCVSFTLFGYQCFKREAVYVVGGAKEGFVNAGQLRTGEILAKGKKYVYGWEDYSPETVKTRMIRCGKHFESEFLADKKAENDALLREIDLLRYSQEIRETADASFKPVEGNPNLFTVTIPVEYTLRSSQGVVKNDYRTYFVKVKQGNPKEDNPQGLQIYSAYFKRDIDLMVDYQRRGKIVKEYNDKRVYKSLEKLQEHEGN